MKLLSKLDSTSMINTDSANQFISAAEKTKLAGIAAGAEVNVNPNWNASSGDSQILNKPTTISGYGITDAYTKTEVDSAINSGSVGLATSTTDGMESSTQFNKLAGIFTSPTVGTGNTVSGTGSMAIGSNNTVSGNYALAQGNNLKALGADSHVEGDSNVGYTDYSHTEGQYNLSCNGTAYPISYCNMNVITLSSTPTGLSIGDKLQIVRSNGSPSVDVTVTDINTTDVTVDITTDDYWSCAVKKSTYAAPTHAEGSCTVASGDCSHAEGSLSIASGAGAHAEGDSRASGQCAHSEGYGRASGGVSHAEGSGEATNNYSHAEGANTIASGQSAHAEGSSTHATYMNSHAEGDSTTASNFYAHAEGYNTTASGQSSHTEGDNNTASGASSHAGGSSSTAADYALAHGFHVGALANQTVIGHYNNAGTAGSTSGTTGDAFIIGNGTSGTLGRGFRVSYAGLTYADGAYSSGGADYAEIYEWKDGNPAGEDRVGHFVTLDGENIVFADASSDYILGIVSANPSVCGDNPIDWCGKYVTDAFGRRKIVYVDMPAVTEERQLIDEDGNISTQTVTVQDAHTIQTWEVNPDYDETQVYVPRDERKEYDYIGTHGKLVVIDDGTCTVNGYCWITNGGIATADTQYKQYRVISRIDDTHIKIVLK